MRRPLRPNSAPAKGRTLTEVDTFAQALQLAGKTLRGKVQSVMTADDWRAHEATCVAAAVDERVHYGGRLLTPDEQLQRVRSETSTMVLRTVIRRMLADLGLNDVSFVDLEAGERLELGEGYALRRRDAGNGYAFHNGQREAGFPVDVVLDMGGRKTVMVDVTASWQSWQGAIGTDQERFVAARRALQSVSNGATPRDVHKIDVLLNEGETQRADQMYPFENGLHALALPLREEAYAIADTTGKRIRPRVSTYKIEQAPPETRI